jgi:hypothetical protein
VYLVKSNSISSLEKQLADKQAKLGQLRNQFSEVRQRADELGDAVAAALVDDAANLGSLEAQLHAAESRLRSIQAATAKVDGEVASLEQKLTAERNRVAREKAAAVYRTAADAMEKLAPAAAKATAAFAEIVGGLPASVPGTLPPAASQILMHWAPGSASFFAGDIVGIVAKSLRAFADEISAGTRMAVSENSAVGRLFHQTMVFKNG